MEEVKKNSVTERGFANQRRVGDCQHLTGKSNIIPSEQHEALAVLYELFEAPLKKLDEIEKEYVRIPLLVEWRGDANGLQTYVAVDSRINN